MAEYAGGNKIRHDLREQKASLIGAVICTVLGMGAFVILNTALTDKLSSESFAMLIILGVVLFSAAAFVLWLFYFDCFCYLRRLKKHGYILPKNKKEVVNGLAGLSFDVNVMENKKTVSGKNRESTVLGGVCFVIAAAVLTSAVRIYLQYSPFVADGSIIILVVIHLIMILGWLGFGFYFGRQCDNTKYKDDVELDADRKNRKNIVEGIMIIVILFVVTIMIICMLYNMAQYISYDARLMADGK